MDGPPPPPPPHGENPHTTEGEYRKSSDLPDGNYDIFIIPPHSAGSGFLYLPSLQCNRNSFLAGVASTLLACFVWSYLSPIVKAWYLATVTNGNGTGMAVLGIGVGVAGWLFGSTQSNSSGDKGNGGARGGRFGFGGFGRGSGGSGGSRNAGPNTNQQSSGANYGGNGAGQQRQQGGNFGGGQTHGNQYSGNQYGSGSPPKSDNNKREKEEAEKRANEERAKEERAKQERAREERAREEHARAERVREERAKQERAKAERAKEERAKEERVKEERAREERARERAKEEAERERAKEETRRKEELRRKMEDFKRKREADAKEKEKKREREAMEKELQERREQLEKEMAAARAAVEKEAREQLEKEAAESRERQAKAEAEAKAQLEKLEAEAKEAAAKEAAEQKAAAKAAAQKEAIAKFAALKEAASKKYAEKKAQDAKKEAAAKLKSASTSNVPRTLSPKKPAPHPTTKPANDDDAYSFRPYDRPRRPYAAGSVYSESSYTPSHSTARTTPPPSHRSTYSTKDPDKIVIQGVYAFNNAFMKTPVAQLVSGQGMITDGLVLRITTEGLFIDDDLRGIGQREWDVKAWTIKLAEVWCPQLNSAPSAKNASGNPFSFRRGNNVPTSEESEAFLGHLLKVCKNTCRLASRSATASHDGGPVHPPQGSRCLHILRASVRDQEGKKYVFVLQDTEAWKVAIGLQRLRAGALVRSLGVCSLPVPDCKTMLGALGYV
ncbi:hypothetical protein DTO013E5_9104 [Penicillium roqueforti]|uniref:Genomic scaffold, ProqFM164S03 n=1 Tax=Penicillium roqueforti (strain FM164) TaxID=1365484 RepID=W6QBC2_PENRF|nr:hypothetical protein DTO012A1_8777 [Penicillium roqueforti]CDM33316.1 unnamed protein product [Penicillium roqueforti FM164]KAI2744984.1 hypothetical protein DTO013F2_7579 [Penicillium roqueforti]KAI2770118.1 hypothetical protein DTO012A8_4999 [Penicillium roqueforti]KAI3065023.1 hypothetical protein CBS147339_9250 [Penicillium roqueforti]